jgi:hypothetical protein
MKQGMKMVCVMAMVPVLALAELADKTADKDTPAKALARAEIRQQRLNMDFGIVSKEYESICLDAFRLNKDLQFAAIDAKAETSGDQRKDLRQKADGMERKLVALNGMIKQKQLEVEKLLEELRSVTETVLLLRNKLGAGDAAPSAPK